MGTIAAKISVKLGLHGAKELSVLYKISTDIIDSYEYTLPMLDKKTRLSLIYLCSHRQALTHYVRVILGNSTDCFNMLIGLYKL